MMTRQVPFACPKCGHEDAEFHTLCPECGRPFARDFIDTQIHPRDPDPTGIYAGRFWARVFLVLVLVGLVISFLASFGLIRIP